MAVIGKIAVGMTANTRQFSKGLKRARRSVKNFTRGLGASVLKVAAFGGALVAAAAGAGMASMIKNSFTAMDAAAKMADRFGIATEALTGLQHAANITGAGLEGMNKGLGFLSKTLGEAKTGIGEGRQALEKLGLSVDELTEIPLDQAFGKISDAMKNLTSQTDKAFVASKLFGRGGLALLNTMELGSEGLKKMAEEALKLGLAFTRIDAAMVEQANDAIARMQAVFIGIFNLVAVQLAPLIEGLTNKFVAFALEGQGMGERISSGFKSVLMSIAKGIDLVKALTGVFQIAQGIIGGVLAIVAGWINIVAQSWIALTQLVPGLGDAFEAEGAAISAFAKSLASDTKQSFDDAGKNLGDAFEGTASKGVEKFFDDVTKKSKDTATATVEAMAGAVSGVTPAAAAGTAAAGAKGAERRAEFKQVSLARMAFGGQAGVQMQKTQEIKSRQLDESNNFLQTIAKNTSEARFAIAG